MSDETADFVRGVIVGVEDALVVSLANKELTKALENVLQSIKTTLDNAGSRDLSDEMILGLEPILEDIKATLLSCTTKNQKRWSFRSKYKSLRKLLAQRAANLRLCEKLGQLHEVVFELKKKVVNDEYESKTDSVHIPQVKEDAQFVEELRNAINSIDYNPECQPQDQTEAGLKAECAMWRGIERAELLLSDGGHALADALNDLTSLTLSYSTKEQVRIDFNKLILGEAIGKGGFGTVVCAEYDGRKVAVKMVDQPANLNSNAIVEFNSELERWKDLAHKHVVQLYGSSYDSHNRLYFVMELCDKSLHKFIHEERGNDIGFQLIRKIGAEVADGLAYLHRKQIIHRDIKPMNVLLKGKHLTVKLCDFGMSVMKNGINSTILSHKTGGTIGYMPPELFQIPAQLSSKGDIYSFGTVMWELLERKEPYLGAHIAVIINSVRSGLRLNMDRTRPGIEPWIYALVDSCWEGNRAKRPTAVEVHKALVSGEWSKPVPGPAQFVTCKDYSEYAGAGAKSVKRLAPHDSEPHSGGSNLDLTCKPVKVGLEYTHKTLDVHPIPTAEALEEKPLCKTPKKQKRKLKKWWALGLLVVIVLGVIAVGTILGLGGDEKPTGAPTDKCTYANGTEGNQFCTLPLVSAGAKWKCTNYACNLNTGDFTSFPVLKPNKYRNASIANPLYPSCESELLKLVTTGIGLEDALVNLAVDKGLCPHQVNSGTLSLRDNQAIAIRTSSRRLLTTLDSTEKVLKLVKPTERSKYTRVIHVKSNLQLLYDGNLTWGPMSESASLFKFLGAPDGFKIHIVGTENIVCLAPVTNELEVEAQHIDRPECIFRFTSLNEFPEDQFKAAIGAKTQAPTKNPTSSSPTQEPTKTMEPSTAPSYSPTHPPTTLAPTLEPGTTARPSRKPTANPTRRPTRRGKTRRPTRAPTNKPTVKGQTYAPTAPTSFQPGGKCFQQLGGSGSCKAADRSDGNFTIIPNVSSLLACKRACTTTAKCTGIEFNTETARCEVHTGEISHVESQEDLLSACIIYQECCWIPLGQGECVNAKGESGAEDYRTVCGNGYPKCSQEQCREKCANDQDMDCSGIEYDNDTGTCKFQYNLPTSTQGSVVFNDITCTSLDKCVVS
uniref:Protein kinase domain-containing protein n=1 Tax=Mucochytrium quahogii TaxID=96639 RepID=A0A7S2RVE4_9STRA|mmetsp:Transcript_40410/g.65124  ORF Transcript_40410/g.65124 Transcript_40410/m.65124 type:complete len:1117 (-) Transcript_40410:748-4098(-)|eukprot:CAMPEP_0203753580 /NCGR_PEP_ID=MMETSP0098-20131031/7330_1 /ASSEMBLY_ACC=CAM_ASM_000208 /TAXON_ID=96639 /ORGANISM=" , Strain NY0313808BC1" /LENGTH=1116 /DNA_ID=CAMNT_0050644243 /DNA_START=514 /DNA_END=3864 /DNA_ORIENTATION=-